MNYFRAIDWSNGIVVAIQKDNCIEEKFCDMINNNFFYQHVNVPTFQKSFRAVLNIIAIQSQLLYKILTVMLNENMYDELGLAIILPKLSAIR